MTRLSVVNPDETSGKVKELFEGIKNKLGLVPNIFKGLANSPVALETYVTMSQILSKSQLTAQEREVIALVCSSINDCTYCAAAHSAIAGMLGLPAEVILDIRKGKVKDEKLQTLVRFTKSVLETKGFVPEKQLQAMRAVEYGDAHIAEVLAVIAQNFFSNFFNHVNDTEVDFPEVPVV
ncbi:MAG: peroxidase-related enzyme [Bdellovibrionales bacterium]|nr:peroxidase-related enzyme [Bdellovibrionales bacterium]